MRPDGEPRPHLVLHFQLLPVELERLRARARRQRKRLSTILREEVWAIRQQLGEELDGHLMWQMTPEALYLTVTTVPWMGVRPADQA